MSHAVRQSVSRIGTKGRFAIVAGILAIAASAFAGCAQQSSTEDEQRPAPATAAHPGASAGPACACEDEPVVDPTLLAFLSLARAAHHEADLALDAKDHAKAIAALERVTKAPWAGKKPPEVIEVTADTLARLADLRSEDGKFDDAARDADAGIALATEPTHYRGRLFELKGVVEQRREKALKDKGDQAGAEKAHKVAMDAFDQAMTVQEDVIGQMMKQKEKEKEKTNDRGGK